MPSETRTSLISLFGSIVVHSFPTLPAPGALGLIDLCRAEFQNYPNECERTTLKSNGSTSRKHLNRNNKINFIHRRRFAFGGFAGLTRGRGYRGSSSPVQLTTTHDGRQRRTRVARKRSTLDINGWKFFKIFFDLFIIQALRRCTLYTHRDSHP